MKNLLRLFGIIAISVIIGISLSSCDEPGSTEGLGNEKNTHIKLTSGTVSNVITMTGETVDISFNANSTGTYYFVVRTSTSSAPSEEAILNQTSTSLNDAMGTGNITALETAFRITGLRDTSTYTVYIIAKNISSTSDLLSISNIKTTAKIKSWTVISRPSDFGSGSIGNVIFSGDKFVVYTNNKLCFSDDGITWTYKTIDFLDSGYSPRDIIYGNGKLLLLASTSYSYDYLIYYSEDGGTTWKKGNNPFNNIIGNKYITIFKYVGDRFIISTKNSANNTTSTPAEFLISTSNDGINWTCVSKDGYTVGNAPYFRDASFGNDIYVGFISTDSFTTDDWELTTGSGLITFNKKTGKFINITTSNYIRTSTDGKTWTYVGNQVSNVHDAKRLITTEEDIFLVGASNFRYIWYSYDGEKWSLHQIEALPNTSSNMEYIACGNGRAIVITSNNIAYTN